MELSTIVTVLLAIILTAAASLVKDTEDALDLLRFQAGAMGAVELIRGLNELYAGVLSEAILDFFSTFLLWTFSVAVTPAIISKGISRAGREVDEPIIGTRKTAIVVIAISILHLTANIVCVHLRLLPDNLDMLPLYLLIFSLSIFNMAVRRDPLKILIGLNMAENAFMPLMAEVPLILLALALGSMEFVNEIAIFIIAEGKTEFRSLRLTHWRERC